MVVVPAFVAYESPGLPDPNAEGFFLHIDEPGALWLVYNVVGVVVASVVCWVETARTLAFRICYRTWFHVLIIVGDRRPRKVINRR